MSLTTRVTELIVYPVKSCAGISLQESDIDGMGLRYDRRWMLVTPKGDFLSQRKIPKMALIKTALDDAGNLTLSMQGQGDLDVPEASDAAMPVTIWNDRVEARLVGDQCDRWLTRALGVDCHLVYITDDVVRQCDLEYAREGDRTGFSDGFPMLLISEPSLDDLNIRLQKRSVEKVDMRRFRPNIVVSGCEPYAEDSWENFMIADTPMRAVKPCSRCPIPTVDPDTGERSGAEPIATLSTYRKQGHKVFFGMNVIHQQQGRIRVGDELGIDKKME